MKIVAVSCGRAKGNSELLCKAALNVCKEEFGAEVLWINLSNKTIYPCTGCEACTLGIYSGKEPHCRFEEKDDMKKIMDELLTADGMLFINPTYYQQVPGRVTVFTNRFLRFDVANLYNNGFLKKKPEYRVGLVCVGGSAETWHSLHLDQLQASLTGLCGKVVDKYIYTRCNGIGHAIAVDDKFERVMEVARNVCRACQKPFEEVEFVGTDYKYMCPVCHSNLIMKSSPFWNGISFPYECAVCGTGGDLVVGEDGKVEFKVAENGTVHCRLMADGRVNHIEEIMSAHAACDAAKEIIDERRKVIMGYDIPAL